MYQSFVNDVHLRLLTLVSGKNTQQPWGHVDAISFTVTGAPPWSSYDRVTHNLALLLVEAAFCLIVTAAAAPSKKNCRRATRSTDRQRRTCTSPPLPGIRVAAAMAGRGFKGHIAVCSTTLLLILNLLVLAGGVASVVLVFVTEHQPSRAAWLIVIAGGFTVASGLIGLCSSTRRGCFTLQLVLLAFSVIGLFATAFAIFFKPTQVRNALDKPTYTTPTTTTLLKVLSAVMFVTGVVQVMVLTLGICVNCCDLNDYYEDIEMTRSMNAKEAKEADKRAARRDESKSAQLAEQMKEKYGKWTDKK